MFNLKITNAQFNCSYDLQDNKINFDISKSIENKTDEIFIVKIITKVFSARKDIDISITCSAEFSIIEDIPSDVAKQLIEKNSVSIMFPYIRSYISTITTVPNMTPIVIPPINVNKLLEETESK
jgi:preprotein translocase subunit SecB